MTFCSASEGRRNGWLPNAVETGHGAGSDGRLPMQIRRVIPSLCALLLTLSPAPAQETAGALPELTIYQLTDRSLGTLGQAALGIRPTEWKHAETKNFVYHFFHSYVAGPVSVEAEFYYNVVAKELEKDTAQWERKSHIFIFEKPEDWAVFQQKGSLDPWTGGLHCQGELFIVRNPETKWQGSTLGHEVTHHVVHRFFGNGVPLWLNEGYAEYAASRNYAAFYRARGYRSRPYSRSLPPGRFMPLLQLTALAAYPQEDLQVATFYAESEKLARYLSSVDKRGFGVFFEALSKGNRIDSALGKGFGSRFSSLEALETEFKAYASKNDDATAAK